MTRVTVICPETLFAQANHLAACLGDCPPGGSTFVDGGWRDAEGGVFAVSSMDVTPDWLARARGDLVRPEHDVSELIDLEAAGAAQALTTMVQGDALPDVLLPDRLLMVVTQTIFEAHAALEALGLEIASQDMGPLV